MRSRRILIAAALAALVTGTLAGPTTAQDTEPDAAQTAAGGFETWFEQTPITVNGDYQPIRGDFCLDADWESVDDGIIPVIWYAPGPAADAGWFYETPFDDSGWVLRQSIPLTINGTYIPVPGHFDGLGCMDILWYAPGPAQDWIWWGESDGSFTSEPVTINGTYQPVVGSFAAPEDFCWGCDTIFWYSTTGGTETIWTFDEARELTVHTAPQVSYSGYRVTAIIDDYDEPESHALFFHRPGPGADHAWGGVRAGATAPEKTAKLTIDGTYEVLPFGNTVLLYAPGPATDRLVTQVREDGTMDVVNGSINGTYRIGSLHDNGRIFFHGPGTAPDSLWTLLPGSPLDEPRSFFG